MRPPLISAGNACCHIKPQHAAGRAVFPDGAGVRYLGGDDYGRGAGTQSGQAWSVPKRDLLAVLQVLPDRDELRIAKDLRDTGPRCGN